MPRPERQPTNHQPLLRSLNGQLVNISTHHRQQPSNSQAHNNTGQKQPEHRTHPSPMSSRPPPRPYCDRPHPPTPNDSGLSKKHETMPSLETDPGYGTDENLTGVSQQNPNDISLHLPGNRNALFQNIKYIRYQCQQTLGSLLFGDKFSFPYDTMIIDKLLDHRLFGCFKPYLQYFV